MVAFFAVPNMQPAMGKLQNYSFEAQIGEKVTWSVSRRLGDGGTVASAVNEFDAVVKARNAEKQQLQTHLSAMTQQQADVVAEREVVEVQQKQDLESLQKSIDSKLALVASYESEVKAQSAEFQERSVEAREAWDEGASRREDIIRLSSELNELRTQIYELTELRRTLVDRLMRIRLDTERMQLRENQLQNQLTGS